MFTTQDLCHEALLGLLTRPGGEALSLSMDSEDPLRPLIHIELTGGTRTVESTVEGRVVGLRDTRTPSPFDMACTDDCWEGSGIWTTRAPVLVSYPDYPYDTDCVDEGCQLPYEPTCLIEYLSLETVCVAEEAADCDAWGREYITRCRIEPLTGCGAPPIPVPLTDCDKGGCVEQWVGTDWCKVYGLTDTPLMPVDIDCYDIDCLQACPTDTNRKIAVCWGGPFEDGVVDDECYIGGYYVSLYDPSDCVDECTVSPWIPLQWRDCYGNIYPLQGGPSNEVWRLGVHVVGELTYKVEAGCTDSCVEGESSELIVSIYSPPYDEECVDVNCVRQYVPFATGSWVDGTWVVQAIPEELILYQDTVYMEMLCVDNTCVDSECYIEGIHIPVDRYLGACTVDILQYLIDSVPTPMCREVDTYGLWGGFTWPICNQDSRPEEVILSRSCIQCEEQVQDGFTYRRGSDGIEYYVRGISNGNAVYVVDIGYLHPTCYEPIWVETWLPVYEDGRFRGRHRLPPDVTPFIRVREVTYSRDRVILHHIEYGRPTLGRIRTQSLLYHNSTDSAVDVEELAITLVGVMLAPCRVSAPCQTVQGEGPDPYLTPLVLDNLLLLASLLDDGMVILPSDISTRDACGVISTRHSADPLLNTGIVTARLGSLPATLTTYATHDLIYNDALYNQAPQYPFEEGVLGNRCMDELWDDDYHMNDRSLEEYGCTGDCVDPWDVREVLPSREVSNRAVAWVLLALSTWRHAMGPHSIIDKAIEQASNYLLGEVQISGLMRQGWTHADSYRDSVPIPTIITSTTVVSYIALMKVYDLYRPTKILSSLVRMHEGMQSYLWNAEYGAFIHEISDIPHISLDSILHGVWFGHVMGRAEMVEGGLSLLQARTRPISLLSSQPIWDAGSDIGCTLIASPSRDVTCETLPVYHEVNTSLEIIKTMTRCGVRYTDPYTKLVMVGDVERKGYLRMLLDGLSTLLAGNQYTIPYLPLLSDYRALWLKHISGDRYGIPSYCYADCLYHCPDAAPSTLWAHDLFQVHANHEVDISIFHKAFLRSKLPFSIPVGYDWPSLESLGGKVGMVLDHWAHELAMTYGALLRARRGIVLMEAVGTQIDEHWSIVQREPLEGDNSLRSRIRERLLRGINSTKGGLLRLVSGVIKEPRILGMQTLPADTRFPTTDAKYSGGDNIYPSFTLEANTMLTVKQVEGAREAKAFGVLDSYVGRVHLYCVQGAPTMTMNIVVGGEPMVYAVYPCCDTPDPCKRVRVNLYLNGLYPYPLYVGLGVDGVWHLSKVHTPRTKWMFRPWQLSMEIVTPIGYY
ncbi:hypothetical protein [Microcoleus phage My-WqHQDG]|nr:hypothetical protein [Microcoleus phage My-WqHQDG]